VISGYTAELASHLVVESEAGGAFEDLDQLLNQAQKVCVLDSAYRSFVEAIPRAADAIVRVSVSEEAFQKLDAGECTGVVNGQSENTRLLKNGEHCDKIAVGPAVMSIMLSQPISREFVTAVSWLTLKHRSVLTRSMLKYQTLDMCIAKAASGQKSEGDN